MKYTIISVFLILFACQHRKPENTGLEGQPMPSFKLLLLDSATVFNTSNIPNGEPIVLLLFGPHCRYSQLQIKNIIENMALLKNIRFYIFTNFPLKELKVFYNHFKLYNYPNITAGIDYTNFFTYHYNAQGVPYLALYGKDKRLINAFVGQVDGKQIKKMVQY